MFDTIHILSQDESCGISFVICAPSKRVTENLDTGKTFDNILRERANVEKTLGGIRILNVIERCTAFDPNHVAEVAVNWVQTGSVRASAVAKPQTDCATAAMASTFSNLQPIQQTRDPICILRSIFVVVIVKFRQSRYPSALGRITYSYCCEIGWKSLGLNLSEFEVQKLVQGWLIELESARVLRRRDGGFVWMNNRVQRRLRERSTEWINGTNCQIIHGCIGRWHARLLFSCSDPLSAKEGIYHHVKGIRWMLDQQSVMDLGEERERASAGSWEDAKSMIEHAEQMLNTSRILFEKRIATTFSNRSFLFLIEEVDSVISHFDILRDKNQKLSSDQGASDLYTRLKMLRDELIICRSTVILREGQFAMLRGITEGQVGEELSMRHAASLLHLRRYNEATLRFQIAWKSAIEKVWKSNSYSYTECVWLAPDYQSNMIDQLPNPEQLARRFRNSTNDEHDAIKLVRLARWGLYLHLNRSQATWVCSAARRSEEVNPIIESDLRVAKLVRLEAMYRAKWFYLFGAEMLRRCHSMHDGRVFEENILLRAHGALVLGIIRSQDAREGARAEDAWRVHGDADSFLGGFPVADGGVTSAIVNLRAAELCLLDVTKDRAFMETRRSLRLLPHISNVNADGALRPKSPSDIQNQIWEVSKGQAGASLSRTQCETLAVKIGEAINWLDKAEVVLIKNPKSRWWWSIYCVIKIKACEYLHALRLARALAANAGQGLEPRILLPSAFIFQDSGLLRLVVEKDFSDVFYLSRVISSLVEILRCESHYASLYSNDDPPLKTYTRQRRHSIPLLTSRMRLIQRMFLKLDRVYRDSGGDPDDIGSVNLADSVSPDVRRYAKHCLAKADNAWTSVCGSGRNIRTDDVLFG